MMKMVKIIPFVTVIVLSSINLHPQEVKPSSKSRLLIYNFITTDRYDDEKVKGKNFSFYTVVIPETIGKTFRETGGYEVIRETGPFSIETEFADKKEKKKYIKKLIELGTKNKCEYIITGSFKVIDQKRLAIRIIVFDVRGQDIRVVNQESDELGARLLATTDLLSQQLNKNIEELDKINLERTGRSPFLLLYKPLSIITLGIDSGYMYIIGDWDSLYNDTYYVSPFLNFDITDDFSLSLKVSSIQSDSEDKETMSYSEIRMLSGSMSLAYTLWFNDYAGLEIAAGGGATKSTITLNPQKPFEGPNLKKDSIDPNFDFSACFVFKASSFIIRGGGQYKRIFFSDKPMDSAIIFAGAGIHF